MSDINRPVPRTAMQVQERQWRSKLAGIISRYGFVRGCLLERERVCGKPNCRCARGHKHRSLYLVRSKEGRSQQMYVPKRWESDVRQWVSNYHDLRDLTERVSEEYWKKVRKRQG